VPFRIAEEGVVAVPGGVILGDVQGLEVVVVEFDFRAVEDAVPHRDEEILELSGYLRDRMQGAGRETGRR